MGMCWAPNCNHYSEQKKCNYFRFPLNSSVREKWISLVQRGEPSANALICSCHFENGDKFKLPTLVSHGECKKRRVHHVENRNQYLEKVPIIGNAVPARHEYKILRSPCLPIAKMAPEQCAVPNCPNNSAGTPEKIFLNMPKGPERRRQWCKAIGFRDSKRMYSHRLAICEDHFDLPQDAENWMFYKTIGKKLTFRKNVIPHKNIMGNTVPSGSQLTDSERKRKKETVQKFYESPRENSRKQIFEIIEDTNCWTSAQVEALIDEYKKTPNLYDNNHEEFNNEPLRIKCLDNIVEALQPCRPETTQADVVSQWNKLIEYLCGQQELQESNLPKKCRSWYMQRLDFVKEYLGEREVKLEDLCEPENQQWTVDVDPLASTSEIEIKEEILESPPAKRFKSEEESTDSKFSKDENDAFGDFVGLLLKKITKETVRRNVIFQIHRVLDRALERNLDSV